jgi:hypothetical protein
MVRLSGSGHKHGYAPRAMTTVDLQAEDDLTLNVAADTAAPGARVCVAVPAGHRDPVACKGLSPDAVPPGLAQVVAYVNGGAEVIVLSVQKLPDYADPFDQDSDAEDFARSFVPSANKTLPPPQHIDPARVAATIVRTNEGVSMVSLVYDVDGAAAAGPQRLLAHQRLYAIRVADGVEMLTMTTSAAGAAQLDRLASVTYPTMHPLRPPTRAYEAGVAFGRIFGIAIVLGVGAVVIWSVLRRQAAKERSAREEAERVRRRQQGGG